MWRFWEEVSARYPSFAFEHGHGLGVLAVGRDVPASVLDFIDEASRQPGAVRDAYQRLGARVTRQWQLLETERERDDLVRRLGESREEVAAAGREIQRLIEEQAALRSSTSWKATAPLRAITDVFRRPRS